MKKKCMFFAVMGLIGLPVSSFAQSCSGAFAFQYDGPKNEITFKDTTVYPVNFQRVYTHWTFGDGTTDTGQVVVHTFPSFKSWWVKRNVKFAQTGNLSNFCQRTDSAKIDSLPLTYKGSVAMMKTRRLFGNTFGLYSLYWGCPYTFLQFNIDTGYSISSSPPHYAVIPKPFAVYTVPTTIDPDAWNFTLQIEDPPLSPSLSGYGFLYSNRRSDSLVDIPTSPTCHAAFFLHPDSVGLNHWVISNYSSPGLSYLWDFGDSTTSTALNPAHTYAYSGNHKICLTVTGAGCSDTFCDTAYFDKLQLGRSMQALRTVQGTLTGIAETSKRFDKGITVFPNPSQGEISVKVEGWNKMVVIELHDLFGRVVLEQNVGRFNGSATLNISQLPSGLYLLSLKEESGKIMGTKKITKE